MLSNNDGCVFARSNEAKASIQRLACGALGRRQRRHRLIKAALAVIYRTGFRYKKAGVCFLDLVPADRVQGGLFDQPDDERSKARMRLLDALNARYGPQADRPRNRNDKMIYNCRATP